MLLTHVSVSAGEERTPAPALPPHAVTHAAHGEPCLLRRGVEPEEAEQQQRVRRRDPLRRVRAAAPLPVLALEREQPSAPTLRGDAGALGCDDVRRLVGEVAHHLPPDRGIRVEQPLRDIHVHLPSDGSILPWTRRATDVLASPHAPPDRATRLGRPCWILTSRRRSPRCAPPSPTSVPSSTSTPSRPRSRASASRPALPTSGTTPRRPRRSRAR